MPDQINFVRERRRQLTKFELQDRVWLKWSLIGLASTVVVSALVVAISLTLGWQVKTTQAEQAKLKKEVSSKQEVERSYIIFINKLKMIKDIVDSRADKQAAIAFFTQVFGPDVLLKEITFEGKSHSLDLRLETTDIFTLEKVIMMLDSEVVKARYPQIERAELRRTNTGSYTLGVTIDLAIKKSQAK